MVTLPGMRPNLFPNAENAKPRFGRVSAVSNVNNPIVPVVASIGVNLGAGLMSSSVPFLSFAAFCAGTAGACAEADSGAAASPAFAGSEETVVPEMVAVVVSSVFLSALLVFFAGFFEKPAGTRRKVKNSNPVHRMINRNMNPNLHDGLGQNGTLRCLNIGHQNMIPLAGANSHGNNP
jgi:hypothetical protein